MIHNLVYELQSDDCWLITKNGEYYGLTQPDDTVVEIFDNIMILNTHD
jgi:hypothetical protein